MIKLAKSSFSLRKKNRNVVDKLYEVGFESTSQLIVQYEMIPNLNIDLSFLKIKRSANKIPLPKRVNVYRKNLPKELMDEKEFAPPPDRPILFKKRKLPG